MSFIDTGTKMGEYTGHIAAMATAFCWTVTALSFESAGKRVGSLPVNFLRLCIGFLFLGIYTLIVRGRFLPTDAKGEAWIWLSVSGLVGFVLGDGLLFRSFVIIGARIAMLMMCAVPIFSAVLGWILMGETLTTFDIIGIGVTVSGIVLVVAYRPRHQTAEAISIRLSGVLLALGGAFGQAIGLVLSKYGMRSYDPFAATHIRIIAGMAGFAVLFVCIKAFKPVFQAMQSPPALARITLGSFFGPFLGVSFSLLAVQHTATGIASTIMSLVPVLIIPPAWFLFHERVCLREIAGAVIAVGGVALLFLTI